ncbi:MAG: diaminopimelate epimerase [Eubacteriales bacterium]|nr:diaminopimelate epimerase [Eubacteriales bacterium]
MKFTKMHGIGNDYVYVNCFQEQVKNPAAVARFVSRRHFGIGSDGLILIKPSDMADCEMEMYNLDGSQGAMCGNGIRCVAKYAYDHGIVDKTSITVATKSGVKQLELTVEDGKVTMVRVNMGAPILTAREIPVDMDAEQVIDAPIQILGQEYRFTAVSMGNPHAVVCLDQVDDLDIERIGPAFESHPLFPDRVNTEFIQVLDRHTLKMRVWERGSGETLACGTGACASAVSSVLNGLVDPHKPVTVRLLGGDLQIFWDQEENQVYMTGPAATVFEGEIDLSFLDEPTEKK